MYLEYLSINFKFHYNLTSMTGTLNEDRCTFMIASRSVLRIMINVSAQPCRESQSTHFKLDKFFFRKSCRL